MAQLIKNVDGRKAYLGILSEEEILEAEKLMDDLLEAVPLIENELEERYGSSNSRSRIEYAHSYGIKLRELLQKHNVKPYQRNIFFQQIRNFASQDDTLPKDRSESREILEYYYKLGNYPYEEVKLINWSEWSQLFDIPAISKNERVIRWLLDSSKEEKITRSIFRELTTGLLLYIKNKDFSFLTEQQLNEKLSVILELTKAKNTLYKKYFTDQEIQPSKMRVLKPKKYREKYFKEALNLLKNNNEQMNIDEICDTSFINVYDPPLIKN